MRRFFVLCISAYLLFVPYISSADLLEQVVQESKNNSQLIDIGNNKQSVGNAVFKPTVGLVNGKLVVIQPLYIRVIKFILRATLILGVTMWILVGVRYVYVQWDEGEEKKLIQYLWNIVIGIVLALSALVIVEIVQSITKSSITF